MILLRMGPPDSPECGGRQKDHVIFLRVKHSAHSPTQPRIDLRWNSVKLLAKRFTN